MFGTQVTTPWARLVQLLDKTQGDDFIAVVNSMRTAHGMSTVGHGMTWDCGIRGILKAQKPVA